MGLYVCGIIMALCLVIVFVAQMAKRFVKDSWDTLAYDLFSLLFIAIFVATPIFGYLFTKLDETLTDERSRCEAVGGEFYSGYAGNILITKCTKDGLKVTY